MEDAIPTAYETWTSDGGLRGTEPAATVARRGDNRGVTKRKRGTGADTFLDTYKKIRKPMPPPEKVIRDRRRELEDDAARREIEEGEPTRGGSSDE